MRYSFQTIVKKINIDDSTGFYLPNFQRPFVWSENQIELFFDSIFRKFPIGCLLIWKTDIDIGTRKFIDDYKEGMELTSYIKSGEKGQKMLIMDGQQRLQALYIGIKGSYNDKHLCLNMLSGKDTNPKNIKYEFKFLKPEEIRGAWYKFNDIVNGKEDVETATNIANQMFAPNLLTQIQRTVNWITKIYLNNDEGIECQEIDSMTNKNLYTLNDIAQIFIRANDAGTSLVKADLLIALIAVAWANAPKEIDNLIKDLNKNGYEFDRNFIIKVCLAVFDKGVNPKPDKFNENIIKYIKDKWENISDAMRVVVDDIYQNTYIRDNKILSSFSPLLPLIYFRYHYKHMYKWTPDMSKYLIQTLIAGSFSSSDSIIDICIKSIKYSHKFDVQKLFEIIEDKKSSVLITNNTLLGTQFKNKNIHLLFSMWYDMNYRPVYKGNLPQVDHIFPKSILKKRLYSDDVINQIANLGLLTAIENGASGKCDTLPEKWFADKSKEYLNKHLIPQDKELWKLENFSKFIEERKKLILEKFKDIIKDSKTKE